MPGKIVLFVCVENAGRSLMAEAIFNANPPPGWHATSGGTRPAGRANPRVRAVLDELSVPLPGHPPQLVTPEMIRDATLAITMGCLDDASCPAGLGGRAMADWALPDPGQLDEAGIRRVRDEIRGRVAALRRELVEDRTRTDRSARAP